MTLASYSGTVTGGGPGWCNPALLGRPPPLPAGSLPRSPSLDFRLNRALWASEPAILPTEVSQRKSPLGWGPSGGRVREGLQSREDAGLVKSPAEGTGGPPQTSRACRARGARSTRRRTAEHGKQIDNHKGGNLTLSLVIT